MTRRPASPLWVARILLGSAMRILGIDPGSRATGYGVVDRSDGRVLHMAHGTLRSRPGASLAERLAFLHGSIAGLVEAHRPDAAAVEEVFVAASPRSALILGQARGAVLAALGAAGVPVAEYAPRTIKGAVAATGRADKGQVRLMVRRLLELERVSSADAADALAAAICHAHAGRLAALSGCGRRRRGGGRQRGFGALVVRRAR